MPLLGLELTNTENKQENVSQIEDSNQQAMLAPLLGTSYSQSIENARGSSERRSPESVCYGKLLQANAPSSSGKSRNSVVPDARGCYLAARPDGEYPHDQR